MKIKMKKERIKIQLNVVFILFCISIFISLLIHSTQAANQTTTNHTNNTKANQNTATQQNTSNTTNQVAEKSSNANLSNLGIRPHDFTGFRYGTTSYEVAVPEDTETVEVYASAQDEKAKVTGTGKKNLEKGENKAEVVVTAEDGTIKTYTINIIREMQQENYDDTDEITNPQKNSGLAKLEINHLKLSPDFKTNVYQYEVKYIGEDSTLEIEAQPTDEEYVIEVIGNENLQEGENFITILVSEEDGANIATYQITVNKSLVDDEAMAKEKAEFPKIIVGVVVAIMAIIAMVVIFMMIHKRNTRLEEEFSGRMSYDDDEDCDYEKDYEQEVPKALKGKRFREEPTQEIPIINKGFRENEKESETNEWKANRSNLLEEEEEDFEKMPKDELKEKFLNGYTSQMDVNFDFDYEDTRYQNNRKKGKHKGKRFK